MKRIVYSEKKSQKSQKFGTFNRVTEYFQKPQKNVSSQKLRMSRASRKFMLNLWIPLQVLLQKVEQN